MSNINIDSWNGYNNHWNSRDQKMSVLWVEKLAHWLENEGYLGRNHCLLDYGCGYFDLGRLILDRCRSVDGFDPNDSNFPTALRMLDSEQKRRVLLFSDIDEIPEKKYDVVVLNSVVQYFSGTDELERFFQRCRKIIKPSGKIVFSDLIPLTYSKYLDALEGLYFAANSGVFMCMVKHLYRAATKPQDLRLFQLDFVDIERVAIKSGWLVKKVDENLTPSRRRYSVVCEDRSP